MIYLGSDHGGFELKKKIMKYFDKEGYEYKDIGNTSYEKDDDYPDYSFKVAEKVAAEDDTDKNWEDRPKGILLCRSAGGVVIAANKVKKIKAVAVTDLKSAVHARKHNDANVIALSGDWMTEEEARDIVKAFIETEFSHADRHVRRLRKIQKYENRG